MTDKVAPEKIDLSESPLEGARLPEDFDKLGPITLMLPRKIELRPMAAYSMVEIEQLPEIPPPRHDIPSADRYGRKDLEWVLRVLQLQHGE